MHVPQGWFVFGVKLSRCASVEWFPDLVPLLTERVLRDPELACEARQVDPSSTCGGCAEGCGAHGGCEAHTVAPQVAGPELDV